MQVRHFLLGDEIFKNNCLGEDFSATKMYWLLEKEGQRIAESASILFIMDSKMEATIGIWISVP